MKKPKRKTKYLVMNEEFNNFKSFNETEAIAHFEQEGFHFSKNGGFHVFFEIGRAHV